MKLSPAARVAAGATAVIAVVYIKGFGTAAPGTDIEVR